MLWSERCSQAWALLPGACFYCKDLVVTFLTVPTAGEFISGKLRPHLQQKSEEKIKLEVIYKTYGLYIKVCFSTNNFNSVANVSSAKLSSPTLRL